MKLSACSTWGNQSYEETPIVSEYNCNKVEVEYLSDLVDFTWPHTPIIETYGRWLMQLAFGAGSTALFGRLADDTENRFDDGVYNCLNQILQKCTSLEFLILSNIDLTGRSLERRSIIGLLEQSRFPMVIFIWMR